MAEIYKSGVTINGYTLTSDMTTVGSGTATWALAARGGEDYFIKQFLSPVIPGPDSLGSAAVKEMKRRKCEAFEKRHSSLMKIMTEKCGKGGLLVYATDFFPHNNHYFKVTHKIDISSITISELSLEGKILVLLTVVQALKLLHDHNIIHSDLKPDNILIESVADRFVSKLIDFDSSFTEEELPEPEEVMGDQVYYSPELINYINLEGRGMEVTCASDIFSLGLIFCNYVYGTLPDFNSEHHYPCIALLNGDKLKIPKSDEVPHDIRNLLEKMVSFNPKERPTIKEIQDDLKKIKSGKIVTYKCPKCTYAFKTALTPAVCDCCGHNAFVIVEGEIDLPSKKKVRDGDSKLSLLFKPVNEFIKNGKDWIKNHPGKTATLGLIPVVLILSYLGYQTVRSSTRINNPPEVSIERALKWIDAESPEFIKVKKAVEILKNNTNKSKARQGLVNAKQIYISWGINSSANDEEALKNFMAARDCLSDDDDNEVDEMISEIKRRTQLE
ncbi:MAG: protein kinase [Nitrospirota bacterium]